MAQEEIVVTGNEAPTSGKKKVKVTEILEQPGGFKFALLILLFDGIGMVFDGYDFMIVSFCMPQIMAVKLSMAIPPRVFCSAGCAPTLRLSSPAGSRRRRTRGLLTGSVYSLEAPEDIRAQL